MKSKLASLLRRWADKLNPETSEVAPIDFPGCALERKLLNVKRVSVQYRCPVQFEEDCDKYISREMASKMADALSEQKAIAISKEREGVFCVYNGVLDVAFPI